jgi:hypothetical protein
MNILKENFNNIEELYYSNKNYKSLPYIINLLDVIKYNITNNLTQSNINIMNDLYNNIIKHNDNINLFLIKSVIDDINKLFEKKNN